LNGLGGHGKLLDQNAAVLSPVYSLGLRVINRC
jgi:hypothetical protein